MATEEFINQEKFDEESSPYFERPIESNLQPFEKKMVKHALKMMRKAHIRGSKAGRQRLAS